MQPGATQVREALLRGRAESTISYDPNVRPTLMGEPQDVRSDLEQIVGLSDEVKASDEDLAVLMDLPALPSLNEAPALWQRLRQPSHRRGALTSRGAHRHVQQPPADTAPDVYAARDTRPLPVVRHFDPRTSVN